MVYIKVNVKAGQKKELLSKTKEVYYEVSVKEKAERNMANKRVMELIALEFGVPVAKIRLVSGHHHPSKMFNVLE
jgi:uncharacterized protein YggU (UPF0235/DUF167 family)